MAFFPSKISVLSLDSSKILKRAEKSSVVNFKKSPIEVLAVVSKQAVALYVILIP